MSLAQPLLKQWGRQGLPRAPGKQIKEKFRCSQKEENPSSERRNFMTALAIGDDYRASLTMFFFLSRYRLSR